MIAESAVFNSEWYVAVDVASLRRLIAAFDGIQALYVSLKETHAGGPGHCAVVAEGVGWKLSAPEAAPVLAALEDKGKLGELELLRLECGHPGDGSMIHITLNCGLSFIRVEAGGMPDRLVESMYRFAQEAMPRVPPSSRGALVAGLIDHLKQSLESATVQFGAHEQAFEASAKRLEELETTYKEKIIFKSAVAFWGVRAKSFRAAARWRLAFLVFGLFAGAFSAWRYGNTYLEPYLALDAKTPSTVLLLLTVATALAVWLLTLGVRLYFSAMHLHEDAAAREILANTYFSLLSHGGATPDERHLMLGALFQPVQTGLSRQVALPVGAVGEIIRGAKRTP